MIVRFFLFFFLAVERAIPCETTTTLSYAVYRTFCCIKHYQSAGPNIPFEGGQFESSQADRDFYARTFRRGTFMPRLYAGTSRHRDGYAPDVKKIFQKIFLQKKNFKIKNFFRKKFLVSNNSLFFLQKKVFLIMFFKNMFLLTKSFFPKNVFQAKKFHFNKMLISSKLFTWHLSRRIVRIEVAGKEAAIEKSQ